VGRVRPNSQGWGVVDGIIIQYFTKLQKKRLNPHLFVTLPPVNPGYISRSAVSAFFAPLLRAHEENRAKKHHWIGSWNSGRQRAFRAGREHQKEKMC
jgi:hypothetical protein